MANRHDIQHIHYGTPAKAEEKKAPKPSEFEIGFARAWGAIAAVGSVWLLWLVIDWLCRNCCGYHPYRYPW